MAGPRYSIIPGDFAEDPRADVAHFRVMNLIGRHTDENGWCRLKQITIGDAVGLTRETVNRKLKDLVGWGYVEKSDQDATGRAIWYRTIMDRGAPPVVVSRSESDDAAAPDATSNDDEGVHQSHSSDNGHVSDGSHVGCNSNDPITSGVSVEDHTTCDRTQSHYNDPSLTPLLNDSPPQPPARGGRGRAKKVDEVEDTLRELIAEKPNDAARRFAIDEVLRPVVTSRKLDAGSFTSGLRGLADWIAAKALSQTEARRVVERILAVRRATVKPSDIEDEVKAVLGYRPQRAVLSGDAELMRLWPDVLADLRCQLGPEKVDAWFSTVVIVLTFGGRAELATHLPLIARFIDKEFSAQIRSALTKVYGVSSFSISTRKVAA